MSSFFNTTHFKRSLLLVFLLIVIVHSRYCGLGECSNESWRLYKMQFKKQYNSIAEDDHRRQIFCGNINMIDAHNERYKRGEVTFEMGVNQFADLTSEEFRRWLHTGSIDNGSVVIARV
ncbi:protein CTLA-2-alpha [Ceratitis capitata]|uniref:(Mediterranean fruit fly) hypothetical protein n=1 Tax=Ceratitis capitata TaxID=7213 RepID=A0A811V9K8_CERCA|nr:protein CTLA-2-alpha [Ceratitis capitata]CAD7011694.1 unnamed protein product [Ceratitis capitata]